MNIFGNNLRKVFYEYKIRKNIGPTGDYVDPGVYWLRKYTPALEAQADKIWVELADGTVKLIRPEGGAVTEATRSWLELRAKHLTWFA